MSAGPGRSVMVKMQLGPACLELPVTDAMLRAAVGLTIGQSRALRACFRDAHGIDPATISPDEIAAIEHRRADPGVPRPLPAGARPPIPASGPQEET